jgi:hypothetical protein
MNNMDLLIEAKCKAKNPAEFTDLGHLTRVL